MCIWYYRRNPRRRRTRRLPGQGQAPSRAQVALLKRVFLRERRRYGLPEARLEIDASQVERTEDRNCAACLPEQMIVWFHPEALSTLTEGNIVGLVRHELAHLLNPSLSEEDTDHLAEQVTGEALFYDHRDIETADPDEGVHRPRPDWLPN